MATVSNIPSEPGRTPKPTWARYFDELEYRQLLRDDSLAGRCVFGILTSIVSVGLLLAILTVLLSS